MVETDEYKFELKILFLGEDFVGKSQLVHKMLSYSSFSSRAYNPDPIQIHTMTLPFGSVRLLLFDPVTKLLRINVDTFMRGFYLNCAGVFLLFDLSNASTLEKLLIWKEPLEKNLSVDIPKILVGTKADLIYDEELSIERIKNFCKIMNINNFIVTSAFTGLNVDLCLNAMIFSVIREK